MFVSIKTDITDVKGCCMWYNEKHYLAEIEDHLTLTITQIANDDVYGENRLKKDTGNKDHVTQLVPIVTKLA